MDKRTKTILAVVLVVLVAVCAWAWYRWERPKETKVTYTLQGYVLQEGDGEPVKQTLTFDGVYQAYIFHNDLDSHLGWLSLGGHQFNVQLLAYYNDATGVDCALVRGGGDFIEYKACMNSRDMDFFMLEYRVDENGQITEDENGSRRLFVGVAQDLEDVADRFDQLQDYLDAMPTWSDPFAGDWNY